MRGEPPRFRFEAAAPADCGALAQLHAASFPQGWDAQTFARFLADPHCLTVVARADTAEPRSDGPAGFVLLRWAADEAEILTLAVAPELRCQGVARRLLRAAFGRLREKGVRQVFLEVGADNHAAAALYSRLGFRDAGRRAGYYREGEGDARDARIMRLDLG
ncbi:MAG: N-acetyltransferase [Methyloligellaceae bacterium]